MSDLITKHLDVWTSALMNKSTAGRGSNGKQTSYGIKKLRELILELAVRGKLVPQDPDDEPATELLKRTIAEKKRLIKVNIIRESRPPVFPVGLPDIQLPAGWVWTNLFEIGEIAPRNEADDTVNSSFVPMQAISEKYGVSVQHEVKPWIEIKSGFTHFREDDIVLAKITPCFQNGKSTVVRGLTSGFGAGTTELHVYRSINGCTVPEYVLIYLKSPKFITEGIPKMTGTAGQKRITRDYFAGNHFPLPPPAEQHRIVAKVDELMALCDQLEQQQTDSNAAHQTLVETLLATLTNTTDRAEPGKARPSTSTGQTEFEEAWQRIAEHFDTLFSTEHSIDQLKQTILQLAVMGKLVPQDPNDEPASVLLEKIAEEKARLVKEGKIKKNDIYPEITDEEHQFNLPVGWEFTRFGNITNKIGSGSTPRGGESAYVENGIPFLRSQNIWNHGLEIDNVAYISNETHQLMSNSAVVPNDILLNITGASLGRCTVFPQGILEANVSQHVTIVRPTLEQTKYFLHYCILSPYIQNLVWTRQVGMAREGLSKRVLELFEIPLPPIAEQHRIVAKVDELMAICDALKTNINQAQTTQIHLADAIVEQAVA